jgi:hypothetical protein
MVPFYSSHPIHAGVSVIGFEKNIPGSWYVMIRWGILKYLKNTNHRPVLVRINNATKASTVDSTYLWRAKIAAQVPDPNLRSVGYREASLPQCAAVPNPSPHPFTQASRLCYSFNLFAKHLNHTVPIC